MRRRPLALLAPGGRLGVIIDSGVASGAATAEHRRELSGHCTIDRFVHNNNGIFPVHRGEQFLLLVAGTPPSAVGVPAGGQHLVSRSCAETIDM